MSLLFEGKKLFIRIACLILVFSSFYSALGQSYKFRDMNLRENIMQVADSYASVGEWKEAVLQYYEYLLRFPEDTLVPLIYFKIASLYEQNGMFDLAGGYLKKVVENYSDGPYELEGKLRLAVFLFNRGDTRRV